MIKDLDFKIGFFFLAFALFFASVIVPTVGEDWRQSTVGGVEFFTVGPRFFPFLTAGIMGILAILLMIGSFLREKAGAAESRVPIHKEQLKPVLVFIGIGIVYVASLPFLGVLLATPVCLMLYFWYFDLRKWVWVLLLSIGITAAIYLCFEKLMMVPLPMGFLEM